MAQNESWMRRGTERRWDWGVLWIGCFTLERQELWVSYLLSLGLASPAVFPGSTRPQMSKHLKTKQKKDTVNSGQKPPGEGDSTAQDSAGPIRHPAPSSWSSLPALGKVEGPTCPLLVCSQMVGHLGPSHPPPHRALSTKSLFCVFPACTLRTQMEIH